MKEYYMNVNFEKDEIDTDLTNLVQNDYNSTKIKFTFDKEGIKQFKMLFPDKTTAYIDEIINDEIILSEGLLAQNGIYKIEICINGNDNRLTDFPTHEFMVRKELINSDEIVEPDDRVPILDSLINQVNALNLVANKEGKITTITITKKDGTTQVVTLEDGMGILYNWQGTSLGIKREDEQEYQYVDLKGEKGDAGAIKMQIVAELPETGSDDTIYLVPITPDTSGNNYAEYVWVNNAWELLGKIGVQVDLSDYYTKQETNTLLSAKANTSDIPTKVSQLQNDSGFITNQVNNLANYYTKTEIDATIGDINTALDLINGEVI